MASFLGLPREIRDRVIEFVISHRADPPQSQDAVGERTTLHDIEYYSPTEGQGVYYAAPIPVIGTYSLLAVNRQIREETLDAIRRFPTVCECDVIIMQEEDLYVTWTYIPPLFRPHPQLGFETNDFKVSFTIRQMGSCQKVSNGFEDQALQDDTLPGRTTCYLISLFEHFIRCGPFRASESIYDRDDRIHTAIINVVTGGEGKRRGLLPDFVEPHRAPEYRHGTYLESQFLINPAAIAEMMVNWFWVCATFLGRSDKKDLGYLIKRLKYVIFQVDGSPYQNMRHEPLDGEWESYD
jgi:hypothetical protein